MLELPDNASPKLLNVSLLIIITLIIISQSICISRVSGISMEPTLRDSSVVISFKNNNIKHGDIVVFAGASYGFENNIIKRAIALPGDRVAIRNGEIYINGKVQEESYLAVNTKTDGDVELVVGTDTFFVLGDNRKMSLDSREIGLIRYKDIIAVMEVVL